MKRSPLAFSQCHLYSPPASALSYWHRLQLISLALISINLTLTSPVLAQASPKREETSLNKTISVTGRGVETIPTTLAQVRLGVEIQRKTAQAAQQEATQRSAAVVDLLQSRQVEQLQTSGISLNPTYSYTDNVQRLTGYTASNIVSFRLKTEQVGDLLDTAVKAGATRIDSISFVATDSAIAAARQQALRTATQDAQQQANTVLSALNLTPKEVVSIQVDGAIPPQPPMPFDRAALAESAKTPVIGGEQQVEAAVTLQISY